MNLNTKQLLEQAVDASASDIFIVAGLPVSMRHNGQIVREDGPILKPDDTSAVIEQIYQLAVIGISPHWNSTEMMISLLQFPDSPVFVSVRTNSAALFLPLSGLFLSRYRIIKHSAFRKM